MRIGFPVAKAVWTVLSAWAVWSLVSYRHEIPAWAAALVSVPFILVWAMIISGRTSVVKAVTDVVLLVVMLFVAGMFLGAFVPDWCWDRNAVIALTAVVLAWLLVVRFSSRVLAAAGILLWLTIPLLVWAPLNGLSFLLMPDFFSGG